MNVLIVDDERVARHKVRAVLERRPEVTHIAECADGAEAVERIREEPVDLVFLDVQLPELTGFDVIRAIGPARMPAVVFVTAYDRYAIEAFDVEAIDYLVKPFDEDRLKVAFDRAKRRLMANAGTRNEPLEQLLARLGPPASLDRLAVRVDGRTVVMHVHEIDWIEAADNYVQLHIGHRSHLVRSKISALEAKLDARRFARVHRSGMVNLDRVVEIRQGMRGDVVVLRDGTTIPLSASRRESLVQRLGTNL